MRLLPYGPRAVLAEFDTLPEVMAAASLWRRSGLAGVIDVVPAARTVLVVHDGSLDTGVLAAPDDHPSEPGAGALVTVEVSYDGPDLATVAASCRLRPEEVVELHSSATYSVAFCGFMPGFPYLVGLPAPLHLPRRATPRQRVPAGSVAIAAEYSGIYPRQSPGGWHVLGTTTAVLWDDEREPPALLPPGTTVRFQPA